MAFVIANLTDAQFTKLKQANIPYIQIPDALVPRFRQTLPDGLTAEEALVVLLKQTIRRYETRLEQAAQNASAEAAVQNKFLQLSEELGLDPKPTS